MKQRQQVQKEIDKLRVSIQTLTRSANPLGKVMDYVQEDLDSMQKELQRWKQENKEHALELKRERRWVSVLFDVAFSGILLYLLDIMSHTEKAVVVLVGYRIKVIIFILVLTKKSKTLITCWEYQ